MGNPTKENFTALQELVLRDIIGSIKANLAVGNITEKDAEELTELTAQLYQHIYQHYDVLGGDDDMKKLLDGAMELPGDKYRYEIEDLKEEIARMHEEKKKVAEEMERAEAEKNRAEAEKNRAEAEIEMLRKEIEKLKAR